MSNKKANNLTKESTGFTQISNELISDNRISLKAKGLYMYLFSKPNNWKFFQKNILKELKESRKAFDNAIKELETFCWIERIRNKDEKGRFSNYDYDLKTSVPKGTVGNLSSVPFSTADNSNVDKGTDNNNTYILNNTYNIKEDKNFLFFKEIIKKYKEPQKLRDKTIEKLYKSLKVKFTKCLKDFETFEELEQKIIDYLEYLKVNTWRKKCEFSVFINQPEKYMNDWKIEKKQSILKNNNPENNKQKILEDLERRGF